MAVVESQRRVKAHADLVWRCVADLGGGAVRTAGFFHEGAGARFGNGAEIFDELVHLALGFWWEILIDIDLADNKTEPVIDLSNCALPAISLQLA